MPAGTIAVGNDVVDLADPETRLTGLHPRFERRVFCASEREALATSPCRHLLHWAFWAAKEGAYKARKRLDPATVFSPREFEVELAPLVVSAGTATGQVRHHGSTFGLALRFDHESLHAIVRSRAGAGRRILASVEPAPGEPGPSVRRSAAAALATALGLAPEGLRIEGRPPVALHGAQPLDVAVSLSHHGRFVAFAAALPPGS